MCMFSQHVERVSDTSIYARMIDDWQVLVYEMRFASRTDVAMVLPLPTRGSSEDAVSFIDLSGYVRFFEDMAKCFLPPLSRSQGAVAAGPAEATLIVHRVGAFEASFVPSIGDFTRLDPRFRLPDDVWSSLPEYRDYGFAVFQLAPGDARVHPMAMRFETRNTRNIYFPTTHVHDGTVHSKAEFDHALYAQGAADNRGWKLSTVFPYEVMKLGERHTVDRTRGTVDANAPIRRRILRGRFPNGDIWVPTGSSEERPAEVP